MKLNPNKSVPMLLTGILALNLMLPINGIAKSKTEDNIKYRQSGMMFMRWNMDIIKNQTIKNSDAYNKDNVIAAANVIDAISHSGIEKLFTPDTRTGKGWKETRAKSELFNQPEKVNDYVMKLTQETRQLVKAANMGNVSMITQQFKSVLRACKSCHKNYRKK